jgi:hypothetical protein
MIAKKTRTQYIREYLSSAKPSERGPTATSKALRKRGIKVTVNHVGMVRLEMGLTKRAKKKVSKKKVSNSFNLQSTIIAKKLLNACKGDLNLARTNLNLVSRLLG